MINEKYGIAICETLHYLNGINQKDLNKIPRKFMQFLNDNCLKDYKCNFDYTKPLKELNISDEARGLIAMICLNYWCINEEEREKFKKHLTENEMKFQEELREKYNPDNLFKNKKTKVEVKKDNSTAMVEYKTSIFSKLKDWFRKLFKR